MSINEVTQYFYPAIKQVNIASLQVSIQLLSSFLTPLIAITAAYIAYQQYRTNKQKLKLDMYEKRFKVYLGLQALLIHILENADVSDEALKYFQISTSESVFIFDKDISDYLNSIRYKSITLRKQNHQLYHTGLPIGEERNIIAEAKNKLLFELTDQEFKISEQKFAKYLNINI
jgi:hypothetical protein